MDFGAFGLDGIDDALGGSDGIDVEGIHHRHRRVPDALPAIGTGAPNPIPWREKRI